MTNNLKSIVVFIIVVIFSIFVIFTTDLDVDKKVREYTQQPNIIDQEKTPVVTYKKINGNTSVIEPERIIKVPDKIPIQDEEIEVQDINP